MLHSFIHKLLVVYYWIDTATERGEDYMYAFIYIDKPSELSTYALIKTSDKRAYACSVIFTDGLSKHTTPFPKM